MRFLSILLIMLMASFKVGKAQPSAVKNASKSVFRLTTYKADGSVLAESNGVFIGGRGEAISEIKPFIGAVRATVTDVKGNVMNVTRILGVNDIYEVAKFYVDGKPAFLPISASKAAAGTELWLVPYKSKEAPVAATVKKVETFMDKYAYYIFSMNCPDNAVSCPFVNASGQVVGLMHPSATSADIYATDVNFINDLQVTGLSANSSTLRDIGIPAALPSDKEQALLALMVSSQSNDSIKRAATISDFISAYPTLADGYNAQAQMYSDNNDFERASKVMETAIKKVDKKDEAHFNYSKLIYNKEIYKGNVPYPNWTLDRAYEEADKAYAINPQPVYQHQQAQILFAKGDYQTAYSMFMALRKTSINNPDLIYEASRCKVMLKAPAREVITMLDSAINSTDSMRIQDAAPYFYARAETYASIDSFRQAVFDYTRYEVLSNGRVDASFFYTREQAEVKARLYQQALNDIVRAIILAPKEPTYYAEKASLELKVNRLDDAAKTAEYCIKLAPDYSDGYLILGLVKISQKDKVTGLSNLEKAKQLGNPQAQDLIDKYAK